ncbi:hypothetical protein Nepgr_033347 [Nepenthes gracilis]|uniref:YLP motif-containing protein 1 n=1 Tax=Nepenthes gracilis TaxID=150966 RepID=A0AAD3TLV8_NEPGR|nr:hypothetical protein Nepgr_033347 [Nepenthes gracilis]
MNHSWRPRPIQGTICPSCSISHFPFCSRHRDLRYSVEHNRPNFDSTRPPPINMDHVVYPNPSDPHSDSRYWNGSPSLKREKYWSQFQMQQHHMGDYGNLNDRGWFPMQNFEYNRNAIETEYLVDDMNRKRLRVDGAYLGSNSNDFNANSSRLLSEENERRLKLIRDHGGVSNGQDLSRHDFRHSFGSGYIHDNVHAGYSGSPSELGMGPPSTFRDIVSEIRHQREENQSGFGSQYGDTNRIQPVEDLGSSGNKIQIEYQQQPSYGRVVNPLDPAVSGHGVGRDTEWGGDRNCPNPQISDSFNQSHGYQYIRHGSSDFSSEKFYTNNYMSQQSDSALWKDFPAHSAYEQRSNTGTENHSFISPQPQPKAVQHGQITYDHHSTSHLGEVRQQIGARPPTLDGYEGPTGYQTFTAGPQYGPSDMRKQGDCGEFVSPNIGHMQSSRRFDSQPLPPPSPPPLPADPAPHWSAELKGSSPPRKSPSVFKAAASSSVTMHSFYPSVPEGHSSVQPYLYSSQLMHAKDFLLRNTPATTLTSSGQYVGEGRPSPPETNFLGQPKIIDASHLFKPPYRATRPDHFVIILRGLPGSGKSYLAKMLRDLEVEYGGDAPRIHSMDDYFMTEVEKVDENDASKASVRGKNPAMKVLEYCYEPEMEEAYRSSMLKAFKKTLEEGVFTFIIVDDRNLRVADFAQFWANGKRSGYEVYILEAPYKDPAGCTARNVHGFSLEEIEKMSGQWEETPHSYLQLDVKSLSHGDDLKESNIQEVDMDMEDGDLDGGWSKLEERKAEMTVASVAEAVRRNGSPKEEKRWDDGDNPPEEVKDLGHSKWLGNLEDDDAEGTEVVKGKSVALRLLQTYGKEGKSVHWGDQAGDVGFSIAALKKESMASLIIGPGTGYNLKSNPQPEEDTLPSSKKTGESKRHSIFQEQLRAERESFRAVFDRRRQRIGGLGAESENGVDGKWSSFSRCSKQFTKFRKPIMIFRMLHNFVFLLVADTVKPDIDMALQFDNRLENSCRRFLFLSSQGIQEVLIDRLSSCNAPGWGFVVKRLAIMTIPMGFELKTCH